uniref:Uncharacterized protein n=1 Tax=Clytia hemisphaerica TaxID=252671 RepID=A0A7M5V7A9_9CNID
MKLIQNNYLTKRNIEFLFIAFILVNAQISTVDTLTAPAIRMLGRRITARMRLEQMCALLKGGCNEIYKYSSLRKRGRDLGDATTRREIEQHEMRRNIPLRYKLRKRTLESLLRKRENLKYVVVEY